MSSSMQVGVSRNWLNAFETLEVNALVPERSRGVAQWCAGWQRVADGTQGVKRSLVDIKTVKKLSMLSDSWKLPTFFGRSLKVCGETSSDFEVFFFAVFLRVRVAGSIKKIMLATPMNAPLWSIDTTSTFQSSERASTSESQLGVIKLHRNCWKIHRRAGRAQFWVVQV